MASSSNQDPGGHTVRSSAAQPLSPYDIPGSRARTLNAAHMCCAKQGIFVLSNSPDKPVILALIHQMPENDVSRLMSVNLSNENYDTLMRMTWGTTVTAGLYVQRDVPNS